jgi:DNA-binding NarL/FixJ family response regulator
MRERPDVCLLDIGMPGNGLDAIWEINARLPTARIIMLTVSDEHADLLAALRAGAHGYLLKTMNFERLPHAVRGAVAGEAPIPRTLRWRTACRCPRAPSAATSPP